MTLGCLPHQAHCRGWEQATPWCPKMRALNTSRDPAVAPLQLPPTYLQWRILGGGPVQLREGKALLPGARQAGLVGVHPLLQGSRQEQERGGLVGPNASCTDRYVARMQQRSQCMAAA